ncbi:T9SS type A sorting domain-containing protein [candidate division WOR-3 bacterium]|nr:T9SS type A sorting domain-containing protein [candidate division WOR-3 bacterium]
MTKFIILLPLLFASISPGSHLTYTLTFSPDELNIISLNGYDCILSANTFSTAEPGTPILPVKVLYFLLPPSAEIIRADIVSSQSAELPDIYTPYPAQPIRPFSQNKDIPFVAPDPTVYGSSTPYPAEIISTVPSGCLAGFRIAGVVVHPVQYLPDSKHLKIHTEMTIRVQYEESRHEPVTLTQSQIDLFSREVEALVANPEALAHWTPASKQLRDGEIDYAIITSAGLVSNWNAFRNWKIKKGINTVVVRTDSIYAAYSGRDNQEKIRNFIRDWWQNKGLKYVLLGGDDNIVPDRKTRLIIEDSTITGNIPTDMYYADLQWSWDSNNNNYFGEMEDTVDLFHDVYIGRAPIDNATNINTFTYKDTMFEKHPDTTYLKKLLLPSEDLFPPYHGENPNNVIASYFPGTWQIAKLKDPGYTQTRDSLNHGFQLCHVAAHGSPTSLGVLGMSQIPGLNNGIKYDIINGINCDCGSFDGGDCIAESLVNYPNGGCIAALLNSRYGLGYPPAMGPSEILDLGIFKALIVSSIHEVGAMHARAKDDCRAMALAQSPTRWCVFENTLFGDPTVPLYSKNPAALAVTHASSIPGAPQMFRVNASANSAPLKDARVCCIKGTEVYSVGLTNSQGWVDLFVDPTSGTMLVTVTAPDCRVYEGTCAVSGSQNQPCLTFRSCIIDDATGNNNQHIDPGETVVLDVWLMNRGSTSATSVAGTLRTDCPYVTFLDSTSNYGTIAAGDSAVGDHFQIQVSSATPQGTEIEFIVHTQSAQGSWDPFFAEIAGVIPQLRPVWVDHDTGCCVLSVTSFGGFGTTYPYGEGSGFKYPTVASYGCLYYGSMVCGTGPAYIADRFYDHPASNIQHDFEIMDTITPILPPLKADEEYVTWYSDAGHSSPKGLEIEQWSLMLSDPAYADFIIICFDYHNNGSAPLTNFYSGMMFDFDMINYTNNIVRTIATRRFTYMCRSLTSRHPTVGIRLLEPLSAANLTAIDHALYVEPSSMMTEAVKDSLLRGWINMPNSNRTDNWSICVSAGPFTIPAGGSERVVYAVVGGNDTSYARIHSDSAQSWWENAMGKLEQEEQNVNLQPVFAISPNPTSGNIGIQYNVPGYQRVTAELYDATGRSVMTVYDGMLNGAGILNAYPDRLTNGIYFVKITRPEETVIRKFVYLE